MGRTPKRILAARAIAVLADAIQLGFLPLFAGGAPEGFDAALDLVVCGAMIVLVGWHWAFLPAFIAEALPGVDLAPTWTLAVLFATRGQSRTNVPAEAIRIEPPRLPPAK